MTTLQIIIYEIWNRLRRRPLLLCVILFLCLVPIFGLNILQVASSEFVSSWKLGSDQLVLNGIRLRSEDTSLPWGLYGLETARNQQLGFQGYFYTFMSSVLGTGYWLFFSAAALFALTIAVFTVQLSKLTNGLFASAFLVTMIGSPWMVSASISLYWALWAWMLPLIFAAGTVLTSKRHSQIILLAGLFAAFAIRFACGYEFMTSTIIAAAIIPVLFVIFRYRQTRSILWGKVAMQSSAIFVIGLGAFLLILLIHANLRGEGNLGEGLNEIFFQDVLRRTYGDPEAFDDIYRTSLTISPFMVVGRYIFLWQTDFLVLGYPPVAAIHFGNFSFSLLLMVASSLIAVQLVRKNPVGFRNAVLYVSTLAIPLSWLILAKGHSWIHTFINFILWYQMFAAAIVFIIADAAARFIRKKLRARDQLPL